MSFAEDTRENAFAAAPRRDLALIAIPLGLLLLGLVVRFLAYLAGNPGGTPAGYVDSLCIWDCYWYGDVAANGYQAYPFTETFGGPAGIANWAFFPAYPALLALVGRLLPLSPPVLGMIVSPLLTLGAVLFSWPLFSGSRRAYYLFAALLLAGPFSFYFSIAYSESLFLLLTVLGFVALRERNYIGAGLAGALLAATRTVGVLFVFAIALEALLALRRPRALLGRPDIVLAIFLAPLGLFAFMAWLYFVTGDALGFAHIQRAWDRESVNPLIALWSGLTAPAGHLDATWDWALAGLAGLALCAVLAAQRRWAMALFSTLCLVLALTQGVESMLRFTVALAPLCIALCVLLARWRWLFWLSLFGFLAL
ncbi:MAG TPA: hypothetical protein VHB74_04420, partial [Devosia sp.]|nr:hypothetical protein [Devosia sp.]